MSRRSLAALAVVSVGVIAFAGAGEAAPTPKPPITGSYSVGPLLPFPNATWGQPCQDATLPPSQDLHPVTLPAVGVLKVVVTGFQGDWDAAIVNAAGKHVAASNNASQTPPTGVNIDETITFKVKVPGKYSILSCNFLGTPLATVNYTFTYAK